PIRVPRNRTGPRDVDLIATAIIASNGESSVSIRLETARSTARFIDWSRSRGGGRRECDRREQRLVSCNEDVGREVPQIAVAPRTPHGLTLARTGRVQPPNRAGERRRVRGRGGHSGAGIEHHLGGVALDRDDERPPAGEVRLRLAWNG